VVTLARGYEFARTMVNTGRMSLANPYPPSPFLPQGGYCVQNVPITLPDGTRGALNDLLRTGTALIAIWFTPDGTQTQAVAQLDTRWPLRVYGCDAASGLPTLRDDQGKLAAQLRAAPGTVGLVRPDGYLAARVERASAAAVEAALEAALGYA
jgi:3-(3-hydroxy-phenyl)propionate hydroxylase